MTTDITDILHVVPVNDMFDHNDNADVCVCGPEVVPIEREDGIVVFQIIHNSFDGRELHE